MIRYYLGAGSVALALLATSCLEFQPPPAPPAHPPEVQAILDAILANLNAVGALTGDLSVVDSGGYYSCTDGWLAMKGTDKTYLHFGSSGNLAWHNSVAINIYASYNPLPFEDDVFGVRTADWWPCFFNWIGTVGAFDLRMVHEIAIQDVNLVLAAGTESIAGITCQRLNGNNLRIWVDAVNPGRVIRLEWWNAYPNTPNQPMLIRHTTFAGWQPLTGGGEAPSTWTCGSNSGRIISYAMTNIESGVTIPDTLFDTMDPGPLNEQ